MPSKRGPFPGQSDIIDNPVVRTRTRAKPVDGRLRARCKEFLSKAGNDAIMRTGDPVQALHDFVLAELGRETYPSLENDHALVLYFNTAQDRHEVMGILQEAYPNMVAREA